MGQYDADICVFGQMIFHDYVTGERETRQKVRMRELPDKPVFSHDDLDSHVFTWCHGNASDKFFKGLHSKMILNSFLKNYIERRLKAIKIRLQLVLLLIDH